MFRPLNEYLSQALRRTGATRQVTAATIVESSGPLVRQIIPELRQTDIRVTMYRDGVLTIGVSSPVVAQELRLRADAVLEVLRDTFPQQPFVRLRTVPLVEEDEW